jgi:hypothetical protein
MAVRRETLSETLLETGFVDIHGASVARMRAYVEHGTTEPEETELDLDSRTAWELAARVGGEVTGDINLALRILARVDPEWVALLLK